MLLQNRNAVIYGGSGAIGGAVARRPEREERPRLPPESEPEPSGN